MSVGISKQESQARTEPWIAQQPYLRDIYARAQGQAGQPRTMYPGRSVVPFAAETEQALAGMSERARGGSPLLRGAQGYTQDVLGGRYLDPAQNPWLGRTFQAAARPFTRQFMTAALPQANLSAYGRGGSGAEANRYNVGYDVYGRSLVDLADKIYGGNYRTERGIQEAAAGRAPLLAEADYPDWARLAGVGAQREAKAGEYLRDIMNRYYFTEDEPRERLAEYSSMIGAPVSTSMSRGRGGSYQFSLG